MLRLSRAQAQADSSLDLAAFFLEDLLLPPEPEQE
jgi:hypothetical protein